MFSIPKAFKEAYPVKTDGNYYTRELHGFLD